MTTDGADTTSTPEELVATLRQLDQVRQRTRAAIHPAWFPLLLFGILGLVSIPFGLVGDGMGSALFWIVAGPAGGYATARYYRDRAMSIGVGVRGRAYTALGIVLFVAAWVGGAVTNSAAVPMLAIAVAYLGFARLERSWPVAAVSAVLGVAALVVAVARPENGDTIITFVFGLSFTVTGLWLRRRDTAG
jgi:hypothetical protein